MKAEKYESIELCEWGNSLKPVKIGICGLGTVGGGTFNVLQRNSDSISARAGREIVIQQVGARRKNPDCDTGDVSVTSDVFEVARNPEIDILVETIGGYETAKKLILTAIEHGKHVVTANKALIAEHGNEIFLAARKNNVTVAYEAAIAGGIPIIKCLREGLAGNQIHWLAGIINGTGNYILTEMGDHGRSFDDVLKEAQNLGYAESDPTFDVEGIDACHKLTIMASIAFGIPLQFNKAYTEGISKVTPIDIDYAASMGFRIKHLGIAKRTEKGVELRVHPTLIPSRNPLANIDGVLNSIVVHGDAVGQTMHSGPGAGAEPTASSVIADIVDITRAINAPDVAVNSLGFGLEHLSKSLSVLPVEDTVCSYYLRIHAENHPGVMNAVTSILSERGINIDAITQKAVRENNTYADIVILTHDIKEAVMNEAIQQIAELPDIESPIIRIRVETMY